MKKIFTFEHNEDDITVDVELRQNDKGQYIFSASVSTYDLGGQCFDEISERIGNNPTFKTIYEMWKKHHLNNMHAGTPKQEQFLKDNNIGNWANNYTAICKILEDNNLLIDNGYKFGTGWLLVEIPTKDIETIKELLR